MSLNNRRRLMIARTAAAAATVMLRGRLRVAAWTLHETLRIGPSLIRNNDWYGPVAKSFATERREVWLTIDDGPDPEQTPALLQLLEAAEARASFFVIGKKVDWNRALCARIVAEGHTLENHTYTHPSAWFWALPCCAMRTEMVRCQHAIHVATGKTATWFRSPAGMTNSCVHPAAARSWLRVAGWSADGLDGLGIRAPEIVVERLMHRVQPGAILMMHEGPGRPSVEILGLLLERLAAEGYRCVIPSAADVF